MEIKSRYQVISDLEEKKRSLIEERDNLNQQKLQKEKEVKNVERNKDDQAIAWDRKIEDCKEDLSNFEANMTERKETIVELIKSVDDSLERFGQMQTK